MPYVRVSPTKTVSSDLCVTRSDDQTGVAQVETVPAGFEEVDEATFESEKATILAFNASYVPPAADVVDADAELVAAISAATTIAELKAALIGQKSEAAVKGRPVK